MPKNAPKGLGNQVVALASLAAALALAAPAPAQAVELTMWSLLTTASQTDVIKKQVDECTAGKSNLTVKFESVTIDTQYSRLLTALQRGGAPDIMNTTEGVVAFLNAKNALAPVTELIGDLGKTDFRKSNLRAVTKDNEIWAIPDWALHQEVWYRKDLFAAAGIAPPKSWAELMAAAKKLTVDTNGDGSIDRYGFAVPMARVQVAPQTFFQIFYSAGGTIFDPETGAYVFSERKDTAVKALQFMIDLQKAASPPASVEWSFNDFRTGFVKGQLAMTNEWGAVVLIAAEQNPEILDKIGVFPFPGPSADQKPKAALAGGYYYMMTKSNPEREAASRDLLKCMFTPVRLAQRTNSRPIFAIPATYSAFKSEAYRSNEYVRRFAGELDVIFNDVMANWYRYGSEAGLNLMTGQIEATTFLGDLIQNAALGRLSVADAVEQMDGQFRKLAGLK